MSDLVCLPKQDYYYYLDIPYESIHILQIWNQRFLFEETSALM